ncbi:aldehyde ferredoxin oxidoreductase family protein [Halomarina halobia]|uniref:Aldehyde ferredoxin oxidoreductase family protein n=1 Tax=Halomarina halobia TaxID=3033386 RepID=A0ABD6A8V8_9EURY|nr:aldehyde ferredoxin oxidoreductase C-terminal domain-containing protein [Halomarina sp. PSR21]
MTGRHRDSILRVDLTCGTVERERVPEEWRRRFLGGKGLGARYLYEELAPGTDPLGPANLLAFALGPLSGYLPGESRYAAVTKSPLTGTFLDSYGGGAFPDALAGALSDCLALLVVGRADERTTLVVEDGDARLRSAAALGGADVEATDTAYDGAVACVGPAGESRVAYATVATDGGDHHAGRGGAGAVMGAKRLKAIVARGDPPEGHADLRERYERAYEESDVGRWQAAGETVESLDFANEVGALATRGWQTGRFEGAEGIGVEPIRERAVGREHPDRGVPGGFRVETDDGESVPRGATPMSLGAGLGIDDVDAVAALGATCDRLGLDVISAGSAVAWAIRAAERGLIDRDLAFGDPGAARELVREIATRSTPLGDALADGVAAAVATYGGDDLVPTVKSMELPAYDPRVAPAMALAYATSDRGACHRRARPIEEEAFAAGTWTDAERVRAVVSAQDARSVRWSLVGDDFVAETLDDLGAEWLEAVGLDYTREELARLGERVWNLARLFNAREGFDRADDRLPEPLREPLDGDEARAIDPAAFEHLLDAYYAARGWGENGLPTRATLARLDLLETADDATPLDDPLTDP